MSNLENLTSKILADAEEKAAKIIEDAKKQAADIVQEQVGAANREKEEILTAGQAEAEKTKELIITKIKIDLRDAALSAKHSLITKVFDQAIAKLNELPQKDYEQFLAVYLSKLSLSGDETLIIPEKYQSVSIDSLNQSLSTDGKTVQLKLEVSKTLKSGFVLMQKGVENNNTFEALIAYYHDDLEKIVSDSLF